MKITTENLKFFIPLPLITLFITLIFLIALVYLIFFPNENDQLKKFDIKYTNHVDYKFNLSGIKYPLTFTERDLYTNIINKIDNIKLNSDLLINQKNYSIDTDNKLLKLNITLSFIYEVINEQYTNNDFENHLDLLSKEILLIAKTYIEDHNKMITKRANNKFVLYDADNYNVSNYKISRGGVDYIFNTFKDLEKFIYYLNKKIISREKIIVEDSIKITKYFSKNEIITQEKINTNRSISIFIKLFIIYFIFVILINTFFKIYKEFK